MFFGPKPPVSTIDKVLLETDFQRVLDCFGFDDVSQQEAVLANDPLLALHSVNLEADVHELKVRIAEIFEVDDNKLGLVFFDDDGQDVPTVQDEDGQFVAHMSRSMLSEKVRVASHLASGFAMVICYSDEYKSLELHSEIVATCYGFGPIMAEASVMTSKYSMDGYDHWSISKHGWLSAIQIGYVMAVQAYISGNGLPDWHNQLVIDARDALVNGLKYLKKTNDCLVDKNQSCLRWNHDRCENAFGSKFPSQRLAALQYFPRNGEVLNDSEYQLVCLATNDKDDFVRSKAYQLLEFSQDASAEVLRAIEIGLEDRCQQVQVGAIRASAIHGSSLKGLGHALRRAIESNDRELMVTAAASMAANELCGEEELNLILEKLRRSLVRGTDDVATLVGVLGYVDDNPQQLVFDYFADDEDLRNSVQGLFDEIDHV